MTGKVLLLLVLCASASAFAPSQLAKGKSTTLSMVPRFDPQTEKWSPANDDESEAAGYPLWRTVLRHGPKAFLTRLFAPSDYDQAVLKFMAVEKVGRWEAMGNMDRFFENAQDWTFERLEAEKKGTKLDYVTLEPKQVVLSSTWACITFWFFSEFYKSLQ